ncbi:hypothetical protein DYH55_03940 [Methylovirgula sp. 4M-Z18]|nr:hypothetical protein DYH55_03940 [Methylovirgula sp. 4M-Z18]
MGSGRGQNGRVLGDATTRDIRPARSINDAIGHFGRATQLRLAEVGYFLTHKSRKRDLCGEMKKVNCRVALLGNIYILLCAALLAFDLFDLIQTP